MKRYILGIVVLILLLAGCSSAMTEEKYLELVNKHLDNTDQALHRVNMELKIVFERDEYWLVKEPASHMKEEVERAINAFEAIEPPEKFSDSHNALIRFFKAELEFASIFITYGETGNQAAIATLGKVTDAMLAYHEDMLFSKDEYRKKGYEDTVDYKALFDEIELSKTMPETEYLIAISDNIEDFYRTLEFLNTILASSSILPIKDNADLLYEGTQALLDYNNLITPPKAYETYHINYLEVLTYLHLTAENLRTYSRIPNEENLQKINDYISKIGASISHVTTLQQLVVSNQGGAVELESTEPIVPMIEEIKGVEDTPKEQVNTPVNNNDRYELVDGSIFNGDRQKLINDALFYNPVSEQGNDYGILVYAADEAASKSELPWACASEGDPLYTGNYQVAAINLKTNELDVIEIGQYQFNMNQDAAIIVKGSDKLFSILKCEGSSISLSMYFYIKDGKLVQIENEHGERELYISHQFSKVINGNILQTSRYVNAAEVTGWYFYDFEIDFEQEKMRHLKTYDSPVQQAVYEQWLRDEYTPM